MTIERRDPLMTLKSRVFPEGTDKNRKLTVDVLDEPGETMRIRIKRG